MRVLSLRWPLASAAVVFAVPTLALATTTPDVAGIDAPTTPAASAASNPFTFTTVGRSSVARDGTISLTVQSPSGGKYTAFALIPGIPGADDATAAAARVRTTSATGASATATASSATTPTSASIATTPAATTPTRATAARAVSLLDPTAPAPLPYGDATSITQPGQAATLKFLPGKAGKAAIGRLVGDASLRVTLDVMFGPLGGQLTTNLYVVHVYRSPQAAAAAAKRAAAAKAAAARAAAARKAAAAKGAAAPAKEPTA